MSRRGWVLFTAMCLIWGVPYLLIKIAVEELSPALVVLARTGLAALVLLPIAVATGQLRGLRAAWLPLVLYTAIEICGPFLLLGHAETRLSSSLTGLLIAAVPIAGVVLGRLTGDTERLDGVRLTGLVLGITGVGALVGFDVATDDLAAVLAVAGAVLGYAVGPIILARRLADLPNLGVVTVSVTLAALVYLPVGIGQLPHRLPSARVLTAVLVLGLVCTALAFLVFFALIAEVGPARATVITYLNPAVAVVLGVLVLDERFTAVTAAGFLLVLAGAVLATRRPPAVEPSSAETPSPASPPCAPTPA